ncbi:MAG: glycosyltransferase [Candidatus Delongbacteria bacterium]|nr:glycosyltransferase [Candidatus Delongbacteria bacterium]
MATTKKENILIITPYLPSFDEPYEQQNHYITKFLFYYGLSWVKAGHEVMMVQCISKYPAIFSKAVNLSEKFIKSNRLNVFTQKQNETKFAFYEHEGVKILRMPISKYIPHRDFFDFVKKRYIKNVLKKIEKYEFCPTIVLSDYLTPSAFIADTIRNNSKTPFFLILHRTDRFYFNKKEKEYKRIIENSSGLLHRSYIQAELFRSIGCEHKNENYIFSGIPDDIDFGYKRDNVKKLIFVGSLKKTKNVQSILEALAACRKNHHYELDIVGSGPYHEDLKIIISVLGIGDIVKFSGRMDRAEVLKKMRSSDCLILISRETFGMVYIEAMSQGCIVIGSKGQGIDGVIIDGLNGFLTEDMTPEALAEKLSYISELPVSKISEISGNAIETAGKFKDSILAEELMNNMKEILSK